MLSFTTLFAMFSYSLIMSISPGPVNMMILSSGINYGTRHTLKFVSGATIGFTLLLLVIGLGLNQVVAGYPLFFQALTLAGCTFIFYLGYQIATATAARDAETLDKVPTFSQGFALQWLNPKAWIASVSGVSMFSQAGHTIVFVIFLAIYFVTCFACLLAWALAGQQATKLLNNPRRLRWFNRIMGYSLMVISVYLLVKATI